MGLQLVDDRRRVRRVEAGGGGEVGEGERSGPQPGQHPAAARAEAQLDVGRSEVGRVLDHVADGWAPALAERDVELAREHGYSDSIEERESNLASVSAPVFDSAGTFIAVLSVSGSADRFRPSPAEKFAPVLVDAAQRLTDALSTDGA